MDAASQERRVRISRIAGRYLVFDIDDVVYIRRHHGICAVLTGTMPQNPTQNLFLSLPVELQADEARLLVDKGVGYIADELAEHMAQLTAADDSARKAYLQHLKQQRRHAQQVLDEERAKAQAMHLEKRKAAAASKAKALPPTSSSSEPSSSSSTTSTLEPEDSLFDPTALLPSATASSTPAVADTPAPSPPSYPLYRYLNARGYYTTPGLRFGGDFSVYPGDPFRYHAHYLANSYGWHDEIPLLDLVTSGRLGTAVKKSFLFGAAVEGASEPGGGGAGVGGGDGKAG
ncbi:69c89e4d-f900-4055-acf6-1fe6d9943f74 [Thermothielavioides terrestris]|uniref:tRNA-splicing endonuclease subunit Sen34 n=1 Tax=Thermothielavioides terrestris TaxID=2587410 RepID=A0A446BBZ5_9PEZI|nr:69c89e4d-f900-4055-acf6-1fe6d9943f74 [Thermothielavioides terrestris]